MASEAASVLLVDDHAVLAETLGDVLEQHGVTVHIATDLRPAAVVAAADELDPDVVLLDFFLSADETALDIIPALAQRERVTIVLTGSADPVELGACLEAGAVAVLRKTQSFAAIVDAVRAAAAGEPAMSQAHRDAVLGAGRAQREADAAASAPFESLSPREGAVLAALVEGKTTAQIAADQFVSAATVRTQVRSLTAKLGVRSRIAAVALAREAGWRQ